MAKSGILDEDSSWAQTFVTVTPQDDGFLREIEATSIVSGSADVPLNLDTWNIVLRRSLTSTKDLVEDPRELEKCERIATECQTYLQGVPKVELPLVYRDEATQTLYIGKDETGTFQRAFDDIITVLNDKPLPSWKKSQEAQTGITFDNEAQLDEITKKLETNLREASDVKSVDSIGSATMETSDLMNFVIDRAIWMSEPVSMPESVGKDAEVQTLIKYNHSTKILTIDDEAQTSLSCEPKYSNSMLLANYSETKKFSKKSAKKSAKKETFWNFPDDIEKIENCRDTDNYFSTLDENPSIYGIQKRRSAPSELKSRRTREIFLHDNGSSLTCRNFESLKHDSYSTSASSSGSKKKSKALSSDNSDSDHKTIFSPIRSESLSSESERNLSAQDEEALKLLKGTFCRKSYSSAVCPEIIKPINGSTTPRVPSLYLS